VNDTIADVSTTGLRQLLLVDDEPAEALLAKQALQASGAQFSMSIVSSGQEALSWLHERAARAAELKPVLVLLDLNMPGWDGETTLKRIRSDPKIGQTPVVILTTSDREQDQERVHGAGANGYVWKPLNFPDFTQFFARLDNFWFDHIAAAGPGPA
jgi:CheY-like chemotaxis protein